MPCAWWSTSGTSSRTSRSAIGRSPQRTIGIPTLFMPKGSAALCRRRSEQRLRPVDARHGILVDQQRTGNRPGTWCREGPTNRLNRQDSPDQPWMACGARVRESFGAHGPRPWCGPERSSFSLTSRVVRSSSHMKSVHAPTVNSAIALPRLKGKSESDGSTVIDHRCGVPSQTSSAAKSFWPPIVVLRGPDCFIVTPTLPTAPGKHEAVPLSTPVPAT
jgi:hypothetical protein